MNLDHHISEIMRLRREADALPDDVPVALMSKIELLARCLVYIGRLSSQLDEDYKRIYATRKRVFAEARIKATKDKEAHAELAVVELRELEAKAYGDSRRWRNAMDSTMEEVHALKLKMRINFKEVAGG
jgi:hypothetical protein